MAEPRDSVIIPCAGSGSRLQLPYPKELLAVAPQRFLIDYTFDLLQPHAEKLRVVVVIGPHKMQTVRYLERYARKFEVAFVYQNTELVEWTGAVLSAAPWFGERNLVLLPDQILHVDPAAEDPVRATLNELNEAQFCFIAVPENEPERIADDGALRLERDANGALRARDYLEKPGVDHDGFNAVWAGFGFRGESAETSLGFMHRSASSDAVPRGAFERSALIGCPAVMVSRYENLGTWSRVRHFWGAS